MKNNDSPLELPGIPPAPKKRGRPPTGQAQGNAERCRASRARRAAEGKKQISVTISLEVIEAIKKHVEFKEMDLGDAVEKALRDRFLRKR